MEPYLTLSRGASAEYTEKRSRFIGSAAPVESDEQAREFVSTIRAKYPDARHNVYAYLTLDGMTRYSDDGEPKGTAGLPLLAVLQKRGITGAAIVVTRYFGGVLLGAAGLLRAYTRAATDAVTASGEVWVKPYRRLDLAVSFSDAEKVKYILSKLDLTGYDVSYGENVAISLYMPENGVPSLISKLTDATSGKAVISTGDAVMRCES